MFTCFSMISAGFIAMNHATIRRASVVLMAAVKHLASQVFLIRTTMSCNQF